MNVDVNLAKKSLQKRPSREEAEEAVRILLSYIGDDPTRDGLIDTPKRVINSYKEFYSGYEDDPEAILGRSFEEDAGYDDMVMLRDIDINSHCEHHMIPFIGTAYVAYFPTDRVVGISKLARVVDIFAKRLQTQETMTAQISNVIENVLKPQGSAIHIDAVHQCMSLRGIKKPNVATVTTKFTGIFKDNYHLQNRFLDMTRTR